MTRTRATLTTFAALALASTVALAAVATAVAHDLTGTWTFIVVTENGTGTPTVTLKQDGEKLTGTYASQMLGTRALAGSVKGDSLSFALATSADAGAEAVTLTYLGVVVDKDNLKGIVDFGGMGGATFTAVRKQ